MADKNKRLTGTCVVCGARCCRYVATQIDEPTCKRDYDNIRWYLLHRKVHVFFDVGGDWYLEFEADCDKLGADALCGYYERRPLICKEHGDGASACEFLGTEAPHERRFSTVEEFEQYLEEKGVDWRWSRSGA